MADLKELNDIAESTLSTLESTRELVKDLYTNEEGVLTLTGMKKSIAITRKISGALIAVQGVGVVLDLTLALSGQTSPEAEILKEVKAINARLDRVLESIKALEDGLESKFRKVLDEARADEAHAYLDGLERVRAAHAKKHSTASRRSLESYEVSELISHFQSIRQIMLGTGSPDKALPGRVYEDTDGHLASVQQTCNDLVHLASRVPAAYQQILIAQDSGEGAEDAAKQLFQSDLDAMNAAAESWQRKCLDPAAVREKVEGRVEKLLKEEENMHLRSDQPDDLASFAREVVSRVARHWPWLVFLGVAYEPVKGFDNHCVSGAEHHHVMLKRRTSEDGQLYNFVLMWRDREQTSVADGSHDKELEEVRALAKTLTNSPWGAGKLGLGAKQATEVFRGFAKGDSTNVLCVRGRAGAACSEGDSKRCFRHEGGIWFVG